VDAARTDVEISRIRPVTSLRYSCTIAVPNNIVLRYNNHMTTRPSIRQSDYLALANFRHEIRRFLNFSEAAARKAGVEPHQHQALLAIKALPVGQLATIGFLAERLQIQHHSAVELADRLETKHLVRRYRGQLDRREVILELTRRGEELLRKLSLSHRDELRSAGPKLVEALNAVITHGRKSSRR
jgi:DNA-binding MarR family transcriptional regulator